MNFTTILRLCLSEIMLEIKCVSEKLIWKLTKLLMQLIV